ncbi:hypothetical protein FRC00_003033 [Tulasnella sp. 408]|nr:hypothetical protein FRC00_003033 [Tulasnella sp. 408]
MAKANTGVTPVSDDITSPTHVMAVTKHLLKANKGTHRGRLVFDLYLDEQRIDQRHRRSSKLRGLRVFATSGSSDESCARWRQGYQATNQGGGSIPHRARPSTSTFGDPWNNVSLGGPASRRTPENPLPTQTAGIGILYDRCCPLDSAEEAYSWVFALGKNLDKHALNLSNISSACPGRGHYPSRLVYDAPAPSSEIILNSLDFSPPPVNSSPTPLDFSPQLVDLPPPALRFNPQKAHGAGWETFSLPAPPALLRAMDGSRFARLMKSVNHRLSFHTSTELKIESFEDSSNSHSHQARGSQKLSLPEDFKLVEQVLKDDDMKEHLRSERATKRDTERDL